MSHIRNKIPNIKHLKSQSCNRHLAFNDKLTESNYIVEKPISTLETR